MIGVTRALTASAAVVAVLLPVAPAMASGAEAQRDGAPPRLFEGGTGADKGGGSWIAAGGHFAEADGSRVPAAVTYDSAVPAGAGVTVAQRLVDGRMSVLLWVDGVESDRDFGAHVHTKPCGAEPGDSGPHYQHKVDPVQPSVDPDFAHPANEIWLDFDSDAEGEGHAKSQQKWNFRAGEARSVVIHEHTTHTGEGHAGQAGDRLACLTVPFESIAEAAS